MSGRDRKLLSARDVARAVLARIQQQATHSNEALADALRTQRLGPADARLCTELVYGVLRRRRSIEHVLQLHSTRPLKKTPPAVRTILNVAAYQLLFLDRVPAHAAVNDAVGAAKRSADRRVAGFVNAVLRKVRTEDLTRGLPVGRVERFGVQHSLGPDVARWALGALDEAEACAWAEAVGESATLCARVNFSKVSRERFEDVLASEGAKVERAALAEAAYHLRVDDPFGRPSFKDGLWTAQDQSAQLVAMVAAPRRGETVLDLCAGRGGKALHLAELLARAGGGRVEAIDTSATKIEQLWQAARRLEIPENVKLVTQTGDAEEVVKPSSADVVVVDAPCSAVGVIRRHPEMRYAFTCAAIKKNVAVQRRLLVAALRALKPGGRLVYAVCSNAAEEGPDLWRTFCADNALAGYEFTGGGIEMRSGSISIWPHRLGGPGRRADGFFIGAARYAT